MSSPQETPPHEAMWTPIDQKVTYSPVLFEHQLSETGYDNSSHDDNDDSMSDSVEALTAPPLPKVPVSSSATTSTATEKTQAAKAKQASDRKSLRAASKLTENLAKLASPDRYKSSESCKPQGENLTPSGKVMGMTGRNKNRANDYFAVRWLGNMLDPDFPLEARGDPVQKAWAPSLSMIKRLEREISGDFEGDYDIEFNFNRISS